MQETPQEIRLHQNCAGQLLWQDLFSRLVAGGAPAPEAAAKADGALAEWAHRFGPASPLAEMREGTVARPSHLRAVPAPELWTPARLVEFTGRLQGELGLVRANMEGAALRELTTLLLREALLFLQCEDQEEEGGEATEPSDVSPHVRRLRLGSRNLRASWMVRAAAAFDQWWTVAKASAHRGRGAN